MFWAVKVPDEPISVGAALAAAGRSFLLPTERFRCQNAGPGRVFRRASVARPAPSGGGFSHAPGAEFVVLVLRPETPAVHADTWFWCRPGRTALVVMEVAAP